MKRNDIAKVVQNNTTDKGAVTMKITSDSASKSNDTAVNRPMKVHDGSIVLIPDGSVQVVVDSLDAGNVSKPIIKAANLDTGVTNIYVDDYTPFLTPTKMQEQTAKDIFDEYKSNDGYDADRYLESLEKNNKETDDKDSDIARE